MFADVGISRSFAALALVFQVMIFCIYWSCVDYSPAAVTSNIIVEGRTTMVDHYYPMFMDIHTMMFIGFGFLMTFLKQYQFGAIGLNFLVSVFAIEWSLVTNSLFAMLIKFKALNNFLLLDITSLINADFACAAVLISFGAVIGKTTPAQLLVMVFLECIFYSLNSSIFYNGFKGVDMGGSVTIHTFGAYFGLSISMVLSQAMRTERGESVNHPKKASSTSSDMFSMIGTIFLFIFWPSFNAALAVDSMQHRVVLNTVLSLCSSCMFAFLVDILLRDNHKWSMESIQNATLAGGVAVGGSSDLVLNPGGAILVGAIAGTISVLGFTKLQAFLRNTIGLDDSCGVHNLHGMPGLFGSLCGIISSSLASPVVYGSTMGKIFPARAPSNVTLAMELGVEPGYDRSANDQALYQFYGLLVTLGIAVASGIFTGFVMKLPIFLPTGPAQNASFGTIGKSLHPDLWYDDNLNWTVESEDVKIHDKDSAFDSLEMNAVAVGGPKNVSKSV